MNMKPADIAKEFRLAKDKKEQIKILADENCCSKNEILDVLAAEGINIYLYRKPLKNETKEEPQEEPKEEVKKVPGVVKAHVEILINDLSEEIEVTTKKLVSLSEQLEELTAWYKEVV